MDKEVVKKFVGMNQENALKTKPRDYAADHRDIALLRLRNYTIGKKLRDEDVVGEGGLERVTELIECLVPFVSVFLYLSLLVKTLAPTVELHTHRFQRLSTSCPSTLSNTLAGRRIQGFTSTKKFHAVPCYANCQHKCITDSFIMIGYLPQQRSNARRPCLIQQRRLRRRR